MKLYNKLGVATALLILGLCSCSKENAPMDKPEHTDLAKAQYSGLSMIAGVNYKIAEEWGVDDTKKSEARALITKTTNDVPKLSINQSNLSIRWAVYTKSGNSVSNVKVGTITNKHSVPYKVNTNMGTGFSVLNSQGNSVPDTDRGTKIGVTVEGGANKFKAGEYAYMVLGGIVYSSNTEEKSVRQCFGYNGSGNTKAEKRYNDPNATEGAGHKRLILAAANSEVSLPFPLTTKVRKIKSPYPEYIHGNATNKFTGKYVNWVKMATKFDARGTMLGIKIINNTKFKVKVKSLEILNKGGITPFATKGYFTPVGMNYANNNADSELKFVSDGATENTSRIYTLEDANGNQHFDLTKGQGTNGRFYFWGYPVNPTKPLHLRVKYEFYDYSGSTLKGGLKGSLIQMIDAPKAWLDGAYYRINLKLKKHPNDKDPAWEKIEFCDPSVMPSAEPNFPTDYELEGAMDPGEIY